MGGIKEYELDLVLVPIGLFVLVAYHARLGYKMHKAASSGAAKVGLNRGAIRAWVNATMKEPQKNGVFVVQTMRNSIMSSALLALAAAGMTAAVGYALGYYGRSYVSAAGGGLELGDRQLAVRPPLKLAAALPCFAAAALCYVRSTALYSDASFVAAVSWPPSDASAGATPPPSDHLAGTLLRASVFRSLGTRAFSSSFPFLMWLYGPVPMLCASLLVLAFLASQDAAPDSPFHTRPPPPAARRCPYSRLDAALHRPDASPLIAPLPLPKDSACVFCPHV